MQIGRPRRIIEVEAPPEVDPVLAGVETETGTEAEDVLGGADATSPTD